MTDPQFNEIKKRLDDILVAELIILSKMLRNEKESSSHFSNIYREAANLIQSEHHKIFEILQDIQQH